MKEEFIVTAENRAETAVLVGIITQEQNERKTEEYLDELEFLADTAGVAVWPGAGNWIPSYSPPA